MASADITVEILNDIRDGIRDNNRRLDSVESTLTHRLDSVESTLTQRLGTVESTLTQRLGTVETTLTQRLGAVETTLTQRLGAVETTLLELAEQQRFVVRYIKAISKRDSVHQLRLDSLEARVDKLETK